MNPRATHEVNDLLLLTKDFHHWALPHNSHARHLRTTPTHSRAYHINQTHWAEMTPLVLSFFDILLFPVTISIIAIIVCLVSADGFPKVKWSGCSRTTGVFPFRF